MKQHNQAFFNKSKIAVAVSLSLLATTSLQAMAEPVTQGKGATAGHASSVAIGVAAQAGTNLRYNQDGSVVAGTDTNPSGAGENVAIGRLAVASNGGWH